MKKYAFLICITLVLVITAGCIRVEDEICYDRQSDSSQSVQTNADGCYAGGENPDKDGFGMVELYALQCASLENRRSYDNAVTALVAQGLDEIIKHFHFTDVEYREYWKESERWREEGHSEICRMCLDYNNLEYSVTLYDGGRLYHWISYEGATMVNRVKRCDLKEEQAASVLSFLEEISKEMPLMSASANVNE